MATTRRISNAQAVTEIKTVAITGFDAATSYRLTIGGKIVAVTGVTSTAATATALSAAWNASEIPETQDITASVLSSTVTLTHDDEGVPFTVTSSVSGGAGTIGAVTTTTSASGPHFWTGAANWSGGADPANGDDVYFDNSDVPVKYGLDQSAVTLNSLTFAASYTGTIGLPEVNADGTDEYVEYREQYLKIGVSPGTLTIGSGPGNGSDRIKINTGTVATILTAFQSGRGNDGELEAILWKGTHASNTLTVYRGEVGVAVFGGESAVIATLKLGYVDNEASDAIVRCGTGVTLTTVNQQGGELDLNSAVTTVTKLGGSLQFRTGAVTTLTNDGGSVVYSSSGTVTTLNVGTGGQVQFDPTARTVTNANAYAGSAILDPQKSVTWTNGISLIHCGLADVSLDVGKHVKTTPVTL